MNQIILPVQVQQAIKRLNAVGYEAYAVGGCVRDSLLHREPEDWDLTTSALPEQAAFVFSDAKLIETGLKHGTVTVILDHLSMELTTYRVESSYSDHRHPDAVSFSKSLKEDLSRRDFTVNAMAYHPDEGLIDIFGGQKDLAGRLIRCVGEPQRRFSEDALRMLRALRFAAQLGFAVHPETAKAIQAQWPLLQDVSMERKRDELCKLLCGSDALTVLLADRELFGALIPPLVPLIGFDQRTPYHCYDIYEHTVRAVAAIEPRPRLRLAALLHDWGKPACFTVDAKGQGHFKGHPAVSAALAQTFLREWRLPSAEVSAIETLVRYHDVTIPPTEKVIRRWLSRLGEQNFFDLLALKIADNSAQAEQFSRKAEYQKIAALAREILVRGDCFSMRSLAIGGRELLELGVSEGKQVGLILHCLLEEVIDGTMVNERETLLSRARDLIDSTESAVENRKDSSTF